MRAIELEGLSDRSVPEPGPEMVWDCVASGFIGARRIGGSAVGEAGVRARWTYRPVGSSPP